MRSFKVVRPHGAFLHSRHLLKLNAARTHDLKKSQTLKAELIHRRAPWKTKESLELAALERVSWFNHHRLLEPIGYIPPAEAESNYYRQLAEKTGTPVSLQPNSLHENRGDSLPPSSPSFTPHPHMISFASALASRRLLGGYRNFLA